MSLETGGVWEDIAAAIAKARMEPPPVPPGRREKLRQMRRKAAAEAAEAAWRLAIQQSAEAARQRSFRRASPRLRSIIRPPSYGRAPFETGADPWGQLGSLVGEELLVPAVIKALRDPATQAELETVVVRTLEADATKKALRPYAIEAAVWATIAITLGAAAWRWITRL